MERDYSFILPIAYLKISTHTLTWSVTNVALKNSATQAISTHTLTWSVTYRLVGGNKEKIISTHTLTWSVTVPLIFIIKHTPYFNSHAHVERDTAVLRLVQITKISTHTLTWSVTGYNRPHQSEFVISTHTLTWSVTNYPCVFEVELTNFNSHAHVERD